MALDLKVATSELLQKNIPELTASLKATGWVWGSLAALRFPGESRTWQLQIPHNQTIKCHKQPSGFPLPTNVLPVRISFSYNVSDASGPQESSDLRYFMKVAKSESLLFPRVLCKSPCSFQGFWHPLDANPPSQSRTSCLHGNSPTKICCPERCFR